MTQRAKGAQILNICDRAQYLRGQKGDKKQVP